MKSQVNEIKVSYLGGIKSSSWKKVSTSKDAAQIIYGNWNKNTVALHESFKVLLLNNGNRVKGIYQVSSGGITGTLVDLRMIFATVLKSLSVAIILTHNHPSGNLKPSKSDIKLTGNIKKAAALFEIKVLDHLIIGPDGTYFSFEDNGIVCP